MGDRVTVSVCLERETHEELKEYGNVSAVVREAVERWLTEHAPARKSKTRR